MDQKSAIKVCLVLSSGGARGLAHIGAIKALNEAGLEVHSVIGSSIGSLVGGIYAMGKMDVFTDWLLTLKKRDIISLMDFTWGITGVMKGDRVFNKIKSFLPDELIENMPIPFIAVATDILNQQEITFKSGSFFDAARASIAIPGVFTPVNYLEYTLVDGGLINPLPLNHVEQDSGQLVVAVNLNAAEEEQFFAAKNTPKYAGYITITQHAILTMIRKITNLSIEIYKPDVVVDIPRNVTGIWEYHRAEYLIEFGRMKTMEALKQSKNIVLSKKKDSFSL